MRGRVGFGSGFLESISRMEWSEVPPLHELCVGTSISYLQNTMRLACLYYDETLHLYHNGITTLPASRLLKLSSSCNILGSNVYAQHWSEESTNYSACVGLATYGIIPYAKKSSCIIVWSSSTQTKRPPFYKSLAERSENTHPQYSLPILAMVASCLVYNCWWYMKVGSSCTRTLDSAPPFPYTFLYCTWYTHFVRQKLSPKIHCYECHTVNIHLSSSLTLSLRFFFPQPSCLVAYCF